MISHHHHHLASCVDIVSSTKVYIININYAFVRFILCLNFYDTMRYDTIRHDTVYLRALKSCQDGQPNLAHGTEKKK